VGLGKTQKIVLAALSLHIVTNKLRALNLWTVFRYTVWLLPYFGCGGGNVKIFFLNTEKNETTKRQQTDQTEKNAGKR
jgi:hypothetical protein